MREVQNHVSNGTVPVALRNGVKHDGMDGESSTSDLRELISDKLRERIQEVRKDVVERVNDRIDDMVAEILEQVETAKPTKPNGLVNSDKYRDKVQTSSGVLPCKEFKERNSILTDLYEIPHFRSVYNIFRAGLILLLLNSTANDILVTGMPRAGFNSILYCFAKLPIVFQTWICMKASVLTVYAAFSAWAYKRQDFPPASVLRKIWDYGWLMSFVLYQVMFSVLSTQQVVKHELPPASSLIILMEQARMLMKTHAFVRSAAPRFLSYKPHTDTPLPEAPSFSHFLYFLFVPTLVYRDSYPRSKKIRWRVVGFNLVEVVMAIFFCAFLYELFICPAFEKFGTPEHDGKNLILKIFGMMIPGMLTLLFGFYCLLHSWMNAFAEVMRFADRMFYKDWWNSTTFGGYYRTWNLVVHDWLHTYIYKDMYEIVTPKNKVMATFAVFTISAIVHEFILGFTFRFFYPVLLLMFGVLGFCLKFVNSKPSNVFMWMSLIMGNGMLVSFYGMEFYARVNCRPVTDGFLDFVIPRSWFCSANSS